MDFSTDADIEQLREEARNFFTAYVTADVLDRVRRTGTVHDPTLHAALAARGWLTAIWPREEGGLGWDAMRMAPIYEEAGLADAPLEGTMTTLLVAETLRHTASDPLRARVLPEVRAGRTLMCLGLTEPDSGSDVAAASTRAVRDGDAWVINGQKMFTTLAHIADFVLLLTRTDVDAPKHKGLTVFLVPMDSEGIEITPVETLGGERTNITFYNDVRVQDSWRVGEVNGGWAVISTALSFERGVFGAPTARCARLLDAATQWAAATAVNGVRQLDDRDVRRRLAYIAIENEVGRLLALRTVWTHAGGRVPLVEGAMAKLFSTERMQRIVRDLMDLTAPDGLRSSGERFAVADGDLERAYRHAPVETIYGGTSEIQRDIIASRRLGVGRRLSERRPGIE
jgi:alkylation response protein AidB-like acyl-CoA dehydrogenase